MASVSTVTVAHVEGLAAPLASTPVAAKALAPQHHHTGYGALHGAVDTAVCVGLTLLTPIALACILVLSLSKAVANTYNTDVRGAWNH